ncbi:Pre-rRNA-processing protein TSR2-domain-containing protein [Lasiosphaeria miniovina]|uniref:Pre-rRNA-processing protein TSR2-domain-containing protein n=1 Tax=Lasiosphaeria miniovina TaxID=1954250 RepID=A0AA40A5K0_9PEZI|nr:Pre-rRNA-processing protein TSR2-domain-containing protein [Lasiosphaeria miniovina]KAK0709748.1 Pre-rRNA-processing protein TSR2-domain-containing protein [Lasiosphaeria miniovina]
MASNSSKPQAPTPAICQNNFEQGVAMALHLWPALTLAVQNQWGGPDSSDKRDWFAGAIVELFPDLSKAQAPAPNNTPNVTTATAASSTTAAAVPGADEEPDQEEVETVLLQVMLDEFEVNVDDESAFEVAEQVMRVRAECARGKFDEVEALRRRWGGGGGGSSSNGGDGKAKVVFKKVADQDDDTDWDTDEDDDDDGDDSDGNEDVEMGDAPAAEPRKKESPEVDEDGFTKVSRKKR